MTTDVQQIAGPDGRQLGSLIVGPSAQPSDAPFDPLTRWAIEELTERKGRRADRLDPLTRLLGCHVWQENETLLAPDLTRYAVFFRLYPERRLAVDRLPAGVRIADVGWRGEIARAHGLRWLPMEKGKATTQYILQAAGLAPKES